MEYREVRIGILVEDGWSKTIRNVTLEDFVREEETLCAFDMMTGVPITPERLISLGFKQEEAHSPFYKWEIEFEVFPGNPDSKTTVSMRITWDPYAPKPQAIYGGTCMNYIHQLQNLFSALTGREL